MGSVSFFDVCLVCFCMFLFCQWQRLACKQAFGQFGCLDLTGLFWCFLHFVLRMCL